MKHLTTVFLFALACYSTNGRLEDKILSVQRIEGNEVTQDDARSEVECPQGYIITGCRCSTAECDGAFTESLQKCYAYGSYKQVPVKAVAVCTKFLPNSIDVFVNRFPREQFKVSDPVVSYSCPSDYRVLICNMYTPFYSRPSYGLGDIRGSRCFFDCQPGNKDLACAIYTTCYKEISGFSGDSFSRHTVSVTGPASEARDDTYSLAECPSGFNVVDCRCDDDTCDGAHPEGANCKAYASFWNRAIRAVATCSKFEGNSALIQTRRAPESGWAKGKISTTCPAGSDLISCNTYTLWHRSPTNGLGVISGSTCSANCAKTADGEGCAIYAQCFKRLDFTFPYTAVISDRVVVKGKPSEARDDAVSEARCPDSYVLVNCRCDIARCDGVMLGGDFCTAHASGANEAVKAIATCVKLRPGAASVYAKKTEPSKGRLSYTCPSGSALVGCNVHTYFLWDGKGANGLANADGDTCYVDCSDVGYGGQPHEGCTLFVKCLRVSDPLPPFGTSIALTDVLGPVVAVDDQSSEVRCPDGYETVSCQCSRQECDGVMMEEASCRAYASGLRKAVTAEARCVKYDRSKARLTLIREPKEGLQKGRLSIACPLHTALVSCNVHTYWSKVGVSGLGTIRGQKCTAHCPAIGEGGKPGEGCSLYAKCLTVFSLFPERFSNLIEDVRVVIGRSSEAKDDTFSLAECPDGFVTARCDASEQEIDGIVVDESWCRAYASEADVAVRATALCLKLKTERIRPVLIRNPVKDFYGGYLTTECPPGFLPISCTVYTMWAQAGVSGQGVVINGHTCSADCDAIRINRGNPGCYLQTICAIDRQPDYYDDLKVVIGPLSEGKDDAYSDAKCPAGYSPVFCRSSQADVDGIQYVDGTMCRAFASGSRIPTSSQLLCAKLKSHRVSVVRKPDKFKGTASYTCQEGSTLLSCNEHSYWTEIGTGVYGLGSMNGRTCSFDCSIVGDFGEGCSIVALCLEKA